MKITTDYIVIAATLYFFLTGWLKGFLKTILGPLSLVLGCAAAYFYYQRTQNMLIGLGISILGPFVIAIIISIFLRIWHKTVNGDAPISSVSRALGGTVSLLWGGTYLVLILVLIAITPIHLSQFEKVQNDVLASQSYGLIKGWLGDKVPDSLPDIQKITNVLKDPKKIEAFQETEEFKALASDERLQNILADEKLAEQIKKKDYGALLSNPKMQELFQDEELLKKIFALNKRISEDTPAPEVPPQESAPKVIEK